MSISARRGWICNLAAFSLWIAVVASAQTPSTSSEVEKRVDSLVRAMMLDEKITLLGGTEGLNTSPSPRLGIPALRVSDGPVGVHDYGLSRRYCSGRFLGYRSRAPRRRKHGQ